MRVASRSLHEAGKTLREVACGADSLLFPMTCLLCEAADARPDPFGTNVCVCDGCRKTIRSGREAYCPRCGTYVPGVAGDPARCGACRKNALWRTCTALGEYRAPLREYVLRAKSPHGETVSRTLGSLAAFELSRESMRDVDAVCYVPTHWTRKALGHPNAAKAIAEAAAEALRRPTLHAAVSMIRIASKQGTLRGRERAANVKNAFAVRADLVAGKRLLLVDDVMTTGSTVREIARVLKDAGVRSLDVMAVARAGPQVADV
ncbi:MAG TPA: phosphoribosyltransferase family protein [Pirellulaceae bacterium]|nr:phosphoribosyltransferase family protein [Pirellulaceae bacterium]